MHGLDWTPPTPMRVALDSDRLHLRPWAPADAEALYDAVMGSLDHLLPWMPWARTYRDKGLAFAHKHCAEQAMALLEPEAFVSLGLGMFRRDTGELVGSVGVHAIHRPTARGESGYWVRREHTGHGYAREGAARVLSWALAPQGEGGLGLQTVRLYCAASNGASKRTIETLGIPFESHQRDYEWLEGHGLADKLGWAARADAWDWRAHRAIGEATGG